MYGIIYWIDNDNLIRFVDNGMGGAKIADTLKEADEMASEFEKRTGIEARVISLECVSE